MLVLCGGRALTVELKRSFVKARRVFNVDRLRNRNR